MRKHIFTILGGILCIASIFGLLEFYSLVGLRGEGIAVTLMEGRGILLEFADLVFSRGVARAPRFEAELAQRIVTGYGLMLVSGMGLVLLGKFMRRAA